MHTKEEAKRKLEKLKLLEEKQRIAQLLPHLYGQKHYKWSREFFESRNRMCLLTAANQIGKSTVQIKKFIHWATAPDLWPSLWNNTPRLMWYLYPSKDLATYEFETKWKYLLPQGEMKDHPQYGWKAEYENKKISAIRFNSGIVGVFKTYAQDVQNLQAGTVDYVGCDEELPAEMYDEIKFRIAATHGYFSLVFTATLGQEFWREAMEERGTVRERFPKAAKWQVSLFDCMKFADGTPSHWTRERVQEIVDSCSSQNELLKRVYGRFVVAEGRKYQAFSIQDNCRKGGPVPKDWLVYGGIDHGSGGEKGHPAAISFIAVSPDYTAGRIFKAWRGDGIETTAMDVVMRYREMKGEIAQAGLTLVNVQYDWASKELFMIASRLSEPLIKADKSHERGEQILNSLFKNRMLWLDEEDPEVMKLANEFLSLRVDQPKNKAKDDLADATRYGVSLIPWNWTVAIQDKPDTYKPPVKQRNIDEQRRDRFRPEPRTEEYDIEAEFAEWNDLYET